MIDIRLADPAAPELRTLLEAHLAHAAENSAKGRHHMLNPRSIRDQGWQFWAVFETDRAVGCGALLTLPDGTAEMKLLHIQDDMRGRGLARRMMEHLAEEAAAAGCRALVLETGSRNCSGSDAARGLYEAMGYAYCEPFGDYADDPSRVCMCLPLRDAA